MYSIQELKDLDKKWREIIFNLPIVDNVHEFLLIKFLLTNQEKMKNINQFPYIFAYEFPLNPEESGAGKIDLILANIKEERIQFMIIEVKYLQLKTGSTSSTSRRRKRRKVEEQSFLNKRRFARLFPEADVHSTYITNETFYRIDDVTYPQFFVTEFEKIKGFYPFLDFSPI